MFFKQIKTNGLGCYSYMIGCPSAGVAAVVDPRRDARDYLRIAEENEMRVTHIFDTHIHADHISGARELRKMTGADIYIHESAPVGYETVRLKDGDEFTLGAATLRVLHTPGHTPNSVSIVVTDLARGAEPEMILTGDLLFVGDAGRPDLAGADILDEQTKNLYDSLYKILGALPDYLEVYPAHGEGSLCGGGMSAKPFSTLGYERRVNPMLQYAGYENFKSAVLSRLPMRPRSFSHIISKNMNGPELICECGAGCALAAEEAAALIKNGALALDLRDAYSFGAAHIPGSVNVDFTNGPRLNWLGMAVDPGAPLALILPEGFCVEDIYNELRRIGYDNVKGWLKGGIDAWIGAGYETRDIKYVSAPDLRARLNRQDPPPVLLDVRTPEEFNGGHIEGSVNLTLDRINAQNAGPADRGAEITIVCQSGFRAGIAASLLKAQGYVNVGILAGGMIAWRAR